jgi:hypothetical protein
MSDVYLDVRRVFGTCEKKGWTRVGFRELKSGMGIESLTLGNNCPMQYRAK